MQGQSEVQDLIPKSCNRSMEKFPIRSLVFSDTDNDISCVEKTLYYAGLLTDKGELKENLQGICIFHTGDLINKKKPDPLVVEFWLTLCRNTVQKGGMVKILAGNHEQEVWQKIKEGERLGLQDRQVKWLQSFIEKLDLFYSEDSLLLLHGYPTFEFLKTLLHFRDVTGKDLNQFNEEHYKKAHKYVGAMNLYAYLKGKGSENYLLYNVKEASDYYRQYGREVAALFRELKIDTVIHGHRPQHSGVQVDYEFDNWIPGTRMIGNDIKVRKMGLGATVIRLREDEEPKITFINSKTVSKKNRKRIREIFEDMPGAPQIGSVDSENKPSHEPKGERPIKTNDSQTDHEENELAVAHRPVELERKKSQAQLEEELVLYRQVRFQLETIQREGEAKRLQMKDDLKKSNVLRVKLYEELNEINSIRGKLREELKKSNITRLQMEDELRKTIELKEHLEDDLREFHDYRLTVENELKTVLASNLELKTILQRK